MVGIGIQICTRCKAIATPVQISKMEAKINELQAQSIELNQVCQVLHGKVNECAHGIPALCLLILF